MKFLNLLLILYVIHSQVAENYSYPRRRIDNENGDNFLNNPNLKKSKNHKRQKGKVNLEDIDSSEVNEVKNNIIKTAEDLIGSWGWWRPATSSPSTTTESPINDDTEEIKDQEETNEPGLPSEENKDEPEKPLNSEENKDEIDKTDSEEKKDEPENPVNSEEKNEPEGVKDEQENAEPEEPKDPDENGVKDPDEEKKDEEENAEPAAGSEEKKDEENAEPGAGSEEKKDEENAEPGAGSEEKKDEENAEPGAGSGENAEPPVSGENEEPQIVSDEDKEGLKGSKEEEKDEDKEEGKDEDSEEEDEKDPVIEEDGDKDEDKNEGKEESNEGDNEESKQETDEEKDLIPKVPDDTDEYLDQMDTDEETEPPNVIDELNKAQEVVTTTEKSIINVGIDIVQEITKDDESNKTGIEKDLSDIINQKTSTTSEKNLIVIGEHIVGEWQGSSTTTTLAPEDTPDEKPSGGIDYSKFLKIILNILKMIYKYFGSFLINYVLPYVVPFPFSLLINPVLFYQISEICYYIIKYVISILVPPLLPLITI